MDLARRKAFILSRLVVAASVLLAAPLWIVFNGAPTLPQSAMFALAQTPLLSVVALLRLGKPRLAQAISIFGWIALAAGFVAVAGGDRAVAALLLGVALIEATLTFELAMVATIVATSLALLALDAGLHAVAAPMVHDAFGDAFGPLRAATLGAPLLAYIAMLAVGAIRVERARALLDERNARELRLLTEAIGDLVVRFDEGGAVSSLTGDTRRSYGLDARDLMGRGFFQRVHVADRPAFLKLVSDAIASGALSTATLRLRVSATPSEFGQFVEPVFNFFEARACRVERVRDDDHSRSVVCVLHDVTAARRADEHIAAARLESELATAGKTRFLANVSHELRTPLNAIIGFSEMLANDDLVPSDAGKRKEYAEIIRNSGQHLLAVVNTILDMSKIESGSMRLSPEPFSLPELVDQCVGMMRLEAEQNNIELTRDYRDGLGEIVGDKRACKQIVINLLSNALKFTPAFGRVKARLYPDGNSLALAVSDSGIGISSADLGRLGDPFFQASACHNRAYEGTGLGLSVVRGLVGLHGGSIVVESAPRRGTCVTIRLPLDCRLHENQPPGLAKIETIARLGAIRQGHDVEPEQEVVKKIA
ncbi:MAG: PAS domain-containing sensor histidine kinase [Methylocystaceae bacterium]|nr:MAG: PAS domain-containing sensor histidine kinase [Methylocystaceae bacterium]